SARLDHADDDEADDEGGGGDDFEINECAEPDTPDILHRAHVGDADDHGGENDRRDQHLHQLDEAVAERLHGRGLVRSDEPEDDPQREARQDLEVETLINRLPAVCRDSHGSGDYTRGRGSAIWRLVIGDWRFDGRSASYFADHPIANRRCATAAGCWWS